MTYDRIAIVGGGLIGASWAALFLAHGAHVAVQDPDPEAEARVARTLAAAWPDLQALGLAEGPVPMERLLVTTDLAEACREAEFVQECGPDRIAVKREIVAALEAHLGAAVPIASSTSSLLASDIQEGAAHPGRVFVAHPFNPPHLIPLVELVAGRATDPEVIEAARAFYGGLGRDVIVVRKEVIGHIANRLSAALYREAVHLVAEGIASVADVDRAVASGPGLRWALMGPHLTYHLGGGDGGFRHYIRHLGPTQAARWAELGSPELTEPVIAQLIAGVDAELDEYAGTDLVRARDAGLIAILQARARQGL
ncbi:3-hydroxyacyl-CoA dehydrogenase [Roseivivax lentus]|uniref:L-gulonate 3-dehydrogenase n=1 Tax=Roseivivax lentus TaxID=633194 RepID=A0A1N7PFC4_9RHOB|nr:3-hydroxyacyl-CoA dehydrogenase NAD-binding domain-containing protein [Roseivivax lentus]SIT09343.1 3-hydroxyacyl-CoA dehydrogenase [Roseivivax lentus]